MKTGEKSETHEGKAASRRRPASPPLRPFSLFYHCRPYRTSPIESARAEARKSQETHRNIERACRKKCPFVPRPSRRVSGQTQNRPSRPDI